MRIRIVLPSFVLPLCLLGLLFGASVIQPGASSQGQDQVTAAQLAAALDAQKQADAKFTRSESAARRFQELSAKIQQTAGTAPVIVQLQIAFRPEGEIQTEAERLAQREAIRQAQDELLNSVFGGVPVSTKRFETLPLLAVTVNAAQLAALQSSPLALDVQEDIAIPMAQAQPPSIPLIGATNAWGSGYTGAGKTIAILDTGVDKNHPALSGKVVSEACYSTTEAESGISGISSLCPGGATESEAANSGVNCTALGGCAHGTSVAGVAAGVAPGANFISIQVNSLVDNDDLCGGPDPCILTVISDLIEGLERVFTLSRTYSIAAANVSLGNGRFTDKCDNGNLVKPAVDQLRSVGIGTVIASGNGAHANALGFPACISSAISVSATGDGISLAADAIAPYSNNASFLSLLAPGYFPSAPIPSGGSANVSGTSIAAAHVSGALAILKQHQPDTIEPNNSVTEILNRLKNSGVNVTDTRSSPAITKPRIKIDAALSCLQNVPADRWKGEYYDNPNLEGVPVLRRDDGGGFLDKNFGNGSPGSACGPGADNFSVKWSRTVDLSENLYRFTINADGGVRLWVDGDKKLDRWNECVSCVGAATVDVSLNEGNHEIILEFREDVGPAYASLSWTTPCFADVPADRWKGEYYDNLNLEGDPLIVSDDGAQFIDKDWGSDSPGSACGIGVDNFSVRWTSEINFTTRYTRFIYTGVGGIRLYLDGHKKLDLWNVTAGSGAIDVETPPGNHEVKFEYREFGGLAIARLSFKPYIPVNFNPGVVQTPDPGQAGTEAVNLPTNTEHGSTSSSVSLTGKNSGSQTRTSLWHSFSGVTEPKRRVTLKFDWTLKAHISVRGNDEFVTAAAGYDFRIEYSLNNGSTWTVRTGVSDSVSINGEGSDGDGIDTSGSESIDLPNPGSIDITQIRIRDRIYANASVRLSFNGFASSVATATVSRIRLEVECTCSSTSQLTNRDSKHDILFSHDILYPQRQIQINSDTPTSSSSLLSRSKGTNYQRSGAVNRLRSSIPTLHWHFTERACHSCETAWLGSG